MITLHQTKYTGSRLIGAMTKLGHAGPKHHAVVIGMESQHRMTYVAESDRYGYRITPIYRFLWRYSSNSRVILLPNNGYLPNLTVARRALKEVMSGGYGKYSLVANNCETFINRSMYNQSYSTQVNNSVIFIVFTAGMYTCLKENEN